MKLDEGLSLSPSDLSAFLACNHLTALDLRAARRALERPVVEDPTAELIRRKGDEHEARYLAEPRAAGRIVLEIPFDHDWAAAARATEETIRVAEADVIYQACLVDGEWRGFADFLERQSDGSYEVVDTKLARHAKPTHIFQLCFYSSVLARIQSVECTRTIGLLPQQGPAPPPSVKDQLPCAPVELSPRYSVHAGTGGLKPTICPVQQKQDTAGALR